MVFAIGQVRKAVSITEDQNANTVYSFYQEAENSLDGIYIGSSGANRYWIPARAYEMEGMCVYNLGTTLQPLIATRYLIEDALKTQPDVKFIVVEVRNGARGINYLSEDLFKAVSDAMPHSDTRTEMIENYLEKSKLSDAEINYDSEQYEYPATRDDWAWVEEYDLEEVRAAYDEEYRSEDKGFMMNFKVDELEDPGEFLETEPLVDQRKVVLDELLDYCKTIEPEVIFVSAPYEDNYELEGKIKWIMEYCADAGFKTMDFNCNPLQDDVNMDWSVDFSDFKHTNTYGAMRYTEYMTKYLAENYKLPDHRGEEGYESWDDAVKHLHEELEAHPKPDSKKVEN